MVVGLIITFLFGVLGVNLVKKLKDSIKCKNIKVI